jgi:mannan endo-1,4-beta-mannosidase
LLLLSAVSSATTLPTSTPPVEPLRDWTFVKVRGSEFVIGDRPFRFVGANIDPLHGPQNRARYREILDALVIDGLTVGRIWALGEDVATAGPWLRQHALFRAGPDDFLEEAYLQLDRVLAAARKVGLRLIITLSNHWTDYGGAPMYLKWAGKSHEGMGFEDFYSDEKTREYFRQSLVHLLSRRNTITGVSYSEDPTIFAWELMNESSILSTRGEEARMHWIREMAHVIRTYDKNHMIAVGLLGYSQRREREQWIRVHKMPEVDYCDSHLYMQNSEGGVSLQRMYDFLDDRAQLARFVIKKPLVIGEFGFRTDQAHSYLGRPRSEWFDFLLRRHFRDGGAGALVWIYQPYSGKPRDYGVYIDRPETEDVRAVLRHDAARLLPSTSAAEKLIAFGPPNPRLFAGRSEPLYQTTMTLFGRQEAHTSWRRPRPEAHVLPISPGAFMRAKFERVGYWDGGPVAHAYGGDTGAFVYRFAPPATLYYAPTVIEIEARMSSEWPGAVAPPDGGSQVELLIDDQLVARFAVPPDDGVGERRMVQINDPRLLSLLATGSHTLSFRVPDGAQAHGLCIYGDYHGSEPPPAGEFSPILVRYVIGPEKAASNP